MWIFLYHSLLGFSCTVMLAVTPLLKYRGKYVPVLWLRCSRVWQNVGFGPFLNFAATLSVSQATNSETRVTLFSGETIVQIIWIFCPLRQEFALRPLTRPWSRTEQPSSSYASTLVNWKTLSLPLLLPPCDWTFIGPRQPFIFNHSPHKSRQYSLPLSTLL